MNYLRAYQILQLEPDSSWENAQTQYRRLAARHHPDRQTDNQDDSFVQINLAFRTLKQHYRQQGSMPLAVRPASVAPQTSFSQPLRRPGKRLLWLAGLVVAFLGWWLWPASPQTPSVSEPASTSSTARTYQDASPADKGYLYPGDRLGAVIERLGPPDDMRGERWYYGASWIEFNKGRISNWHSDVDTPLPIHLTHPQ